jgi:hypothetical protein
LRRPNHGKSVQPAEYGRSTPTLSDEFQRNESAARKQVEARREQPPALGIRR